MSNRVTKYKRKKNRAKAVFISLSVMLGLLLIAYLGVSQYYKTHFYTQTFINGVDCSNLTVEEAREKISYEVHTYKLLIEERNNKKETISGADIGLDVKFDTDVSELLESQSPYKWVLNSWGQNKIKNPFTLVIDEKQFKKAYDNLECFKEENIQAPKDAYLQEYVEDVGFTIAKEDPGNEVLKEEFSEKVLEAIHNLQPSISIDESDCYKKPAITSEDSNLSKAVETANKYASTKLTYEFGKDTEVLDAKIIGPAISISKDFKVKIDKEKIRDFVNYIGKNYNSFGMTRTLKTSYGVEIKITGGDYGWWMNRDAELEEIMECIKNGEQKVKTPVYYQTANQHGDDDVGDTYVEINLSAQHLFLIVDGKKVLESDFVSGTISTGHETPTGTYPIQYTKKDATLVGENYSQPVKYWMPFNGDIGLHDAGWRSGFGGDIFLRNGSHGCINLPPDIAKQIFSYVQRGTAVYVYKLNGTESYDKAKYKEAHAAGEKAKEKAKKNSTASN